MLLHVHRVGDIYYGHRILPEELNMRVFIAACIAAAVIAVIAALALNTIQKPADVAFSTSAVRI
jgi:hypothetical protein